MIHYAQRLHHSNQMYALQHLIQCAQMYEALGEPLKALGLLQNPPVILQGHPALNTYIGGLIEKVKHCASEEAYLAQYAKEERGVLTDEKLLNHARALHIVDYVHQFPPRELCSVGPGEGTIENEILSVTTVRALTLVDTADVMPLAAELRKRHPDAKIESLSTAKLYDLVVRDQECIMCSEVLEHVPDPKRFVAALATALRSGGRLILTTPAAEFSFEPQAIQEQKWYWHVSMQTLGSLKKLLTDAGFVNIEGRYTEDGCLFFTCQKA